VNARPQRPAARLLVTDTDDRLLLFRFTPDDRPPFWCTPGGALDPGESFEVAARRELFEETGFDLDPGPCIDIKHVSFITIEGVAVDAEERYFAVRVSHCEIETGGHTALEQRVMQSHRWWTRAELQRHDEIWFPKDLIPLWRRLIEAAP
jgi:8-oxo-dGTP pyrophosphatase MutT (NUDIX family)